MPPDFGSASAFWSGFFSGGFNSFIAIFFIFCEFSAFRGVIGVGLFSIACAAPAGC